MIIHSSSSEIDPEQWKELVVRSPTASFFQTPECYQFFASLSFLEPFVFGISENNTLVGILCGFIISNGNSIKQYMSRRAIVSGGAMLDPNITAESLQLLLQTAKQKLRNQAIYLELRNYNDYSMFETSFELSGFKYSPHLNFHVSTPDHETALKQLKTSKRRDVKLSKEKGAEWFETSEIEDLKDYYELLSDLYKNRIKIPLFPFEFFEKLLQLPLGKLFVVKYEGKVIGGSICVVLPGRKIYEWFVCGLDGETKNIYPSTLATWAAIEYAAINDISCFDMMGAGKPDESYGVREFKSRFGGEMIQHGRYLYICNPLLYNIGKIYMSSLRLYPFFKKLKHAYISDIYK